MWRVQNSETYYVARFNPLEDNFRLYTVLGGSRRQLASAAVTLEKGRWHEMTITQQGARFTGALDGKTVLEYSDTQISTAGVVGLWTKADAVTLFDGFHVTTPAQ